MVAVLLIAVLDAVDTDVGELFVGVLWVTFDVARADTDCWVASDCVRVSLLLTIVLLDRVVVLLSLTFKEFVEDGVIERLIPEEFVV